MKKQFAFLILFVGLVTASTGQNQKITLKDIWSGTFRTQGMNALHSMKSGKQYTILNHNRNTLVTTLDKYNYETLQKLETIISSEDISELPPFTSYAFSDDESKVILGTEIEPVYRRSRLGKYYVYNLATKTTHLISEHKIQEPSFSPDGSKVAYVFENNIYIKNLLSNTIKQVTKDGEKNKIINGITDWVYEEEFAFVKAFQWNATGTHIAFIKFYEAEVPEFSMDIYGENLYPSSHVFKYPKAGEKNADVSLHIYSVNDEETQHLNALNAYYIPRIQWTHDAAVLSIQKMNRHQNHLELVLHNIETKSTSTVLEERDDTYIDITDHLTFLEDHSFIWTSEKNGYNHIYHYDKTGKLINQITRGNWEVTAYYGYDKKSNRIFYQSVENGSMNRDIYAIKLNGKKKQRLSKGQGTHDASFSSDFSYYINTFSSTSKPYTYTLHSAKDGKKHKEIRNNDIVLDRLKPYRIGQKELSVLKVDDHEFNMWMIKPVDFDPNKKYPLFMYQYSGPGSQSVSNRWLSLGDYWYHMLAQQGYIVVCVDGRGTGYKGADFKKMTYKELGKYEVEDQIAAAKTLSALPYIDEKRIGIWGWSYGGFMASNCILKGNDVFKMAIAVAPVTSWRFYDTIYTERYMQTPQENPSGYDDNSPINHVEKLKGSYLIVHGSGDDNVHVQNTMRMVEALIQANKQFDWAIYPDKNHGIYGGNTRLQLYTKMTNFIKKNL